jgi:hypothetical protein
MNDAEWFESLDAEWKAYIGDVSGAAEFAKRGKLYSMPNGAKHVPTTSLAPLARATGLRELLLYTRDIDSLHEIPPMPALQHLAVQSHSNDGVERFPALQKFFNRAPESLSPTADFLAPLAALTALTTLTVSEGDFDLTPLAGCAKLKDLTLRLHNPTQFSALAGLRALAKLDLDAQAIAGQIDNLDWSAASKITHLTISGGRLASFDFVQNLPRLKVLYAEGFDATGEVVDVAAIAALPKIADVRLAPIEYSSLAAFAGTPTLKEFVAGYSAFDELKGQRPDLPYLSMSGRITPEQSAAWQHWLQARRNSHNPR